MDVIQALTALVPLVFVIFSSTCLFMIVISYNFKNEIWRKIFFVLIFLYLVFGILLSIFLSLSLGWIEPTTSNITSVGGIK